MKPSEVTCGTPPCIAERIEESLKELNKANIEFIERLLTENSKNIILRIDSIDKKFDKEVPEIFGRLRGAENRLSIVEDRQVGKIACGEKMEKSSDSDKEIKGRLTNIELNQFSKNEKDQIMSTVEWVTNQRRFFGTVKVIVLGAIIMGMIGWGLYLFDIHGKNYHPIVKQEQVKDNYQENKNEK